MEKMLSALTFTLSVVLILSSCTQSKMVSCPDYGSDRSVLVSSGKSYKSVKYKAPKSIHQKKKIKTVSSNSVEIAETNTLDVIFDILPELSNDYLDQSAQIELRPLAMHIKKPVQELELGTTLKQNQLYASIGPSEKIVADFRGLNSHHSNSIESEISDVLSSSTQIAIVTFPIAKESKHMKRTPIRTWVKRFKESVKIVWANKPAMGMAIASLACALVGLLVAAIPMGIAAILFASSALGRLKGDPGQAGRGIAIAGMVVGILDIALMLLFLAAA